MTEPKDKAPVSDENLEDTDDEVCEDCGNYVDVCSCTDDEDEDDFDFDGDDLEGDTEELDA